MSRLLEERGEPRKHFVDDRPGAISTWRPRRAAKSSARGWSQRTMPVVAVPSSGTANPALRAKPPPEVIGTDDGQPVARLKASA